MTIKQCLPFLLAVGLFLLPGCGRGSGSESPLSDSNVNLVFVVSPDLNHQGPGDVDPATANLTPQGLQRSLLMAAYLREQVLEYRNVTAITVLEPMTHLQTANGLPDMSAMGYIQQFALLNEITLQGVTANSYPIAVSYGEHSVPRGVANPQVFRGDCQGLSFNDAAGDNIALATRILDSKHAGFYVFSAPWETTSALLTSIKESKGYDFEIPASYAGPNYVYAISVSPQDKAAFFTFDSNVQPPATFPAVSVKQAACDQQQPFHITRAAGVNGAKVPWNSNTSETVYLMRHAEAHPAGNNWDDGNYVGNGQWRALALPEALRGKISPDEVYSIDPAQAFNIGNFALFSYIRPALTVWPYVVANNLPYRLVAHFPLGSANDLNAAEATREFFFTGQRFSNKKILLAWEHAHFPPLIIRLIESYGGNEPAPALTWPDTDYDTIWTVTLDDRGNLTLDNALCEGIDSQNLPDEPPQF